MRGTLNHPGNNDVESPGVGTGKTLEKKFRGSLKGSIIIDHQLCCLGATGWPRRRCVGSRESVARETERFDLATPDTDCTYVGYPLRPFPSPRLYPCQELWGHLRVDRGLPLVNDEETSEDRMWTWGQGTRAGLQTADRSRREWCIQGSALLVSTGLSMRMLQVFHE